MRKLFASIIALLACLTPALAMAQVQPWVYAADYGKWALKGQSANTYTFTPGSVCQIPQTGVANRPTFYAFSSAVAYAPVLIQDANQSNSEVVTPTTAYSATALHCGVNLSAANSHTTFNLQSGTGGLQEAINAVGGSTQPYVTEILLTPQWYKQVSSITAQKSTVTPASILASAVGSAQAVLVDITSTPWTYYTWTGSGYAVGGQSQLAPTLAVTGAGAGTSPSSVSIAGNNSTGTISFKTGTAPTASAAVFTLTWPAVASGGYAYAPGCSFTSIGSTAYLTGTSSSVAGPPAVATFTSGTTALAASTTYVFSYRCK